MPNYRRVFENGYSYFLTVVTHYRNPILIDNIELLRESFREAKGQYHFIIDAIVVLPDHFHMIMTPECAEEYPCVIKTIKQYFSMHCDPKHYAHLVQSESRRKKGYKPVWQKRYYEHAIRDERDFRMRLDYIHYNPVKHGLVEQASKWPHSSFGRYVELGMYDADWAASMGDIEMDVMD